MHCDDLGKVRENYRAQLKTMSTESLVKYTLSRDHCDILERELAERLAIITGLKDETH